MRFESIISKDNKSVKYASKLLNSSKFRREEQAFIIEGVRLCTDALDSGIELISLFFTKQALAKYADDIDRLSQSAKESMLVSEPVFSKISCTENPQGVVCVCKTPDISLKSACIDNRARYVALENISDPSNLGAVARTAEALGITCMFIIGNTTDPFGPKALRASMGAMFRLKISVLSIEEIASMKEQGFRFIASVVDRNAESINSVEFENGDIVIIGNEGNGLSEELKNICDKNVTIPISGRAESFNAAAAAAILLWELVK